MNKKKLIKEIIEPYMLGNGLVLKEMGRGYWCWGKEVQGEPESIAIWDIDGRITMTIGTSCGVSHVPAEHLLHTLRSPRTNMWDWSYSSCKQDKEQLIKDILLDFRDILDLNGERVLLEHAEARKKKVPNRKHFHYLLEHYDELVQKYSEELSFKDESIVEKWEMIAHRIIALHGMPLDEVEETILGYVAVMETEMVNTCGGIRGIDEEAGTCYVWGRKRKISFNFLTNFFWLWMHVDAYSQDKEKLERYVNNSG